MAKRSRCPGCKHEFLNGRAYSVHLTCCKALGSATDSALKKHKINTAKKSQAKRLDIAARKELMAQATMNQGASSSQGLLDDQDMDADINESEVPTALDIPSPPRRPSGHPNRQIRLPLRYRDELPPNPNPPIITVSENLNEHDDEPLQPAGRSPSAKSQFRSLNLLCSVQRRTALGFSANIRSDHQQLLLMKHLHYPPFQTLFL